MSWWTSANLHPKTKNRFVVVFSNAFYLPNVKSISKPEVQIETKEYRLLNHTFNYPGNAKWQPVTVKFVDMNGAGEKTEFFDTSQFLWQVLNNTGYAYPYFDESAIREPIYTNVLKDGETARKGHHISTKINFRDNPRTDAKEFETWRTITTPEKSSNIANSFGLGLEGEIDMKAAGASRQRVAIYQISSDSIINEAWYLVNPIVKNIKWGDLAYEDDALVEYELQIVYDWAILDRQANGTKLVVDEEPYKYFMTTLETNKDAIEREENIEELMEQEAQIRARQEEERQMKLEADFDDTPFATLAPSGDNFIDQINTASTRQQIEKILTTAKESGASELAIEGLKLYAADRTIELQAQEIQQRNERERDPNPQRSTEKRLADQIVKKRQSDL